MKMNFIYAALLSAVILISCGTKEPEGETTTFAPDLSFSEKGAVTVGANSGVVSESYEVTISRTKDLSQAVGITISLDETLIPAGKEVMGTSYYSFPAKVTLPAGSVSVPFKVTFNPKALKDDKGDDYGKYVLPLRISAVDPTFSVNSSECSIVMGLDLDTPTVTVETGQTFILSFGTDNSNTETIKLTARASLVSDFTKLSYESVSSGIGDYNKAHPGENRSLLPSSAYSFGDYTYVSTSRRFSIPVTLDCSGVATGSYVLPLKMKSTDAGIAVVQDELCFIAVNVVKGVVGIIVNGDFSTLVSTQLYSKDQAITGEWRYTGGWNTGGATVTYNQTAGVDGSPCIVIAAKAGMSTDVMVSQKVTGLNPEKAYKVTAKIKIEGNTKGRGANIAEGPDLAPASDGVTGTKGWVTETFYVPDPVGGEVQISLRLGYNSADSDGTAYFDDVVLSEDTDMYLRQSDHVKLMIPKNKIPSGMTDADIDTWLENLDKVYMAYKDLFSGRTPWGGIRMKIRSAIIPAWAYAGNPIQWNTNYITSELTNIKKNGDWSFGLMHEIGHNFASHIGTANYAWNFNEEMFANFRMGYALMTVPGAKMYQSGIGYTTNVSDYYKLSYNKTIAKGLAGSGDAIQYTFHRIVDKYGWEPFIKAFDYLYSLEPGLPAGSSGWTGWQKFNFFLDTVDKYLPAGESTRSTYTTQELTLIQAGFN